MALGLGDIRVLSKPGQPLVAEIPVISNEPGELESARAALASPATFARVGLERPSGLISDLQFQFTQDARGHAVIRVTSSVPVDQKAISFLIEVDWGNGRLVREYSALIDAPNTAAAIAEPAIEAPRAGADNTIVRDPVPAAMPAELPSTPPQAPPAAPAPARAASTAAAARPAPPPVAAVDGQLTVQRGQTLSQIAAGMARGSGYSLDQTMLALLRSNPDAFIGGNINRLKQGAVLRTPQQDALAQIGAAEATALVREQAAQWRQARAPIPQPADAGAAPAPARAAAQGGGADGARLEIAPAVANDSNKAGTMSGTSAGGEGDMLANEQLQQAKEDIATRDAEIQELRNRVGELEKLQKQQTQLIAMKDTDLAAAQQRLAQARPAEGGGFPMWLLGGVVLVLAGVAAWFAARRRKPSPFAMPRREYDAVAMAAAVPAGTAAAEIGEYEQAGEAELEEARLHEDERGIDAVEDAALPERVEDAPSEPEKPLPAAWGPTWHQADGAGIAPLNPAPAGRDRLELAVAYLDLGDKDTARSLLLEVAAGNDPQARGEALALLGQLG